MTQLTITRPDDWHLHLRDGQLLAYTVPDAARYFGRAIIMPNLLPPVLNTAQALAYRERILAHRPTDSQWKPLMVLYLTDNTDPAEIERATASGHVVACKYYPAGATTNSDSGVTQLDNIYPVLARMEKIGMPLLLHGEVTDTEVDIFDREAVFIDRHLGKLINNFPALKIVLEHITTHDGAQFVAEASANIAATITPQHLLFNRNPTTPIARKPPAAVPVVIPIMPRSNSMPKPLIKPMRWTSSKGLPVFLAQTSMACPAILTRSRCSFHRGKVRPASPLAVTPSHH